MPYCTYSMPSRSVKASSCAAVEPASRMWYPLTETVFHFGTSFAQKAKMSVMSRIDWRGGKMYSFCAMNSLRMSFWMRPGEGLPVGPLLLGDHQVHREDHRRRRVDRHRRRDVAERDAVEQPLHVGERHDADAALADFAERELVIGIAAHQRRQVEGHAEPAAARLEQRLEALVGLLRRPEPGELPHGPELAAVAGRVNAAGVGELAGIVQVARRIEVGQVVRGVETVDRAAGDRRERDRALGRLLQRRLEDLPLPPLLGRLGADALHKL